MNSIRINRVTIFFLGFLALATLGAGTAYQNGLNLLRGQMDVVTGLLFIVGALAFAFALVVLGRIVYLTTAKEKIK